MISLTVFCIFPQKKIPCRWQIKDGSRKAKGKCRHLKSVEFASHQSPATVHTSVLAHLCMYLYTCTLCSSKAQEGGAYTAGVASLYINTMNFVVLVSYNIPSSL
jgi:hypothetical protein